MGVEKTFEEKLEVLNSMSGKKSKNFGLLKTATSDILGIDGEDANEMALKIQEIKENISILEEMVTEAQDLRGNLIKSLTNNEISQESKNIYKSLNHIALDLEKEIGILLDTFMQFALHPDNIYDKFLSSQMSLLLSIVNKFSWIQKDLKDLEELFK